MSKIDLSKYGITNVGEIVYNPSYEELFQAEMDPANEGFEKGVLTNMERQRADRPFYRPFTEDKFILRMQQLKILYGDGVVNKPVTRYGIPKTIAQDS